MTSSFSSSPVITQSWKKDRIWIYNAKNPKPSKRKTSLFEKKLENKSKPNMFQNSFICYKDRKGCLGQILAFFPPLENSKWHAVFPIQSALTVEWKPYIMHRQKHSEVSELCGDVQWITAQRTIFQVLLRDYVATKSGDEGVLDASCLWSLQIGSGCQAWTRGRADAEQSLRGQLQRPELWKFGSSQYFCL